MATLSRDDDEGKQTEIERRVRVIDARLDSHFPDVPTSSPVRAQSRQAPTPSSDTTLHEDRTDQAATTAVVISSVSTHYEESDKCHLEDTDSIAPYNAPPLEPTSQGMELPLPEYTPLPGYPALALSSAEAEAGPPSYYETIEGVSCSKISTFNLLPSITHEHQSVSFEASRHFHDDTKGVTATEACTNKSGEACENAAAEDTILPSDAMTIDSSHSPVQLESSSTNVQTQFKSSSEPSSTSNLASRLASESIPGLASDLISGSTPGWVLEEGHEATSDEDEELTRAIAASLLDEKNRTSEKHESVGASNNTAMKAAQSSCNELGPDHEVFTKLNGGGTPPSAAMRTSAGVHRALFTDTIGASVLSSRHGGLVVSHVFPGSAAAHHGMQVGDSIVELNGNPLGAEVTEGDLVQMLNQLGRPITLGFARGSTNQLPHTGSPSPGAVAQGTQYPLGGAHATQEGRKAAAVDTSSDEEEEDETPVSSSTSRQQPSRAIITDSTAEGPSAPPADPAAVAAATSHTSDSERAGDSRRSLSATSRGVSGGGGGGSALAAQLADPAANTKTKRDFERRGGLPTAVVAGETDLLLLNTNSNKAAAAFSYSSANSNRRGGGGEGSSSAADPTLLMAQRRARTQLAAEQAKEHQRLSTQLAATQALLDPAETSSASGPSVLSVRRRDAFLNAAYRGAATLLSGSDAGAALFGTSHDASSDDIGSSSRGGRGSLIGNGNSSTTNSGRNVRSNRSSSNDGPMKRRLLSSFTIVEKPVRPSPDAPQHTKRFEVQILDEHGVPFSVQGQPSLYSRAAAESWALAEAPPLWTPDREAPGCELCGATFAFLKRRHHCRNCGAAVCDACAQARWPAWALPSLYLTANAAAGHGGAAARGTLNFTSSSSSSGTSNAPQRVCVGCDRAAFSFRAALAAGNAKGCAALLTKGNVNLRAPLPPLPPPSSSARGSGDGAAASEFTGRLREKPVHLAAMSGSIPLLKWLIMDHCVPCSGVLTRNKRGNTAANLSPIEFAARGLHVDALAWLVRTGASHVSEIKAQRCLAVALHATLVMHTLDEPSELFLAALELSGAATSTSSSSSVHSAVASSAQEHARRTESDSSDSDDHNDVDGDGNVNTNSGAVDAGMAVRVSSSGSGGSSGRARGSQGGSTSGPRSSSAASSSNNRGGGGSSGRGRHGDSRHPRASLLSTATAGTAAVVAVAMPESEVPASAAVAYAVAAPQHVPTTRHQDL